MEKTQSTVVAFGVALALGAPTLAQDADLAQELTNPVADLLTIPIQMTFEPLPRLSAPGWLRHDPR